jgi:outer membrane receptor protein involved in Fe transport
MKNFTPTRKLLALACLTALVSPVMAQNNANNDVSPADAKKASNLETITVTGTRISNPNVISPTPISVLTAADIKATGAINIGDIMTRMPQLATTFTMGNSSRYIGTAGVQSQDLRNLGTSRTLVLVNGRRFVGSSAGDTAVDVNMIPTDWVERVEIITGGASAIYGADAVTGVVNFILKKNYQGASLSAQYGTSEHGGFNEWKTSLTGGMNFAQNRGNVAVSVEHSSQDPLEFHDRFGNKAYRSILTPGGPTDSALFANAGSYTNYEGGTFSLGGKRYVFDPNGNVRLQNLGTIRDKSGCADCDHLSTNQVLQLQPNYNRTTFSSVASFDITPEQHLYAEGTYSHVNVTSYGQPAFSAFGPYVIARDNAYVTPALGALMDAAGKQSISVSRFDVDAGRRGEDTKRNLARLVLGGRGVLSGDWEYDASVVYGVMEENRHNLNNRIVDRFNASIDAVRDPTTGNIVCRSSLYPGMDNPTSGDLLDPIALGGGCVPTSIFGNGAINPASAQWFNTSTLTSSRLTQFVGGGTVTNNSLFQMPFDAGAASMVAGVEYRRETSSQFTDPLDQAGLTFLNAIPNSSGAYNVKEGYIEFAAPLLSGRPFAQNLTFDAAARFSDYNTVGHTKTWRWGLDWAIDDNIRLRGTISSAVRAPNIGELYSGQSQNYGFVNDPCSASQLNNAKDPGLRKANCAAMGVPAMWESTQGATVGGISGSNPNLKPELGRTWTAGFVFTPQFLEGFGFSADYWNIRLTDAIDQLGFQDVVNRCADSPTGLGSIYCRSFTRTADHEVANGVIAINQNIAELSTSGIDVGTYYAHQIGKGKMQWNLDATRVINYTSHPFQDDPSTSIQYNGTATSYGAFPKWKGSLRATYTLENWVFNWNMRYFSSMLRVSNESYASNPTQTTPIRAGAGFFNDVRTAYTFNKSGWQAYLGITNVFDRNPPVNFFGTGGGSGIYDAVGRAYYAGFNYNF